MAGLESNHSRLQLEDGGLQDRCLQEKDETDRLPDIFDGTEQDFTSLLKFRGFILHLYLLMTLVKLSGWPAEKTNVV